MYISTRTYKFIVMSINVICAILGSLLIWFGAWLYQSVEDAKFDHGEELASIVIMTLGAVLICTAIYGSVVTVLGHINMLIGYAVVLIVLLVIQIILVSISYTALNNGVSEKLQQGFDELWDPLHRGPSAALSFYEEWLQCCGRNSPEDYYLLDKFPTNSCCKDHNCIKIFNLYKDGCEDKFRDYVKVKVYNFNLLSWVIIVTEFVGSIFACLLIDSIRNYRDLQRFYS
ncbi:23 kDa integral membrane protein [Stomoxys calcitrans]|uniref:Tetraspanin n=1 Tax=Stomoxys calcitrans TaxID=35570 RepID=A0A1I8P8S6_STOCA|nr:23 kDa integral membrane protein [Stomoxys calcitrans]